MSNPKRAGRVCTALAVALTAGSLAACGDGYKPKPLSENAVSLTAALNADAKVKEGGVAASFTEKNIGFATEFFKRSFREANTLVSPLSLAVALSMTANGAGGNTLSEMEEVLGAPLADINGGLSSYMSYLEGESGKEITLSLADSIWVRDNVTPHVNRDFLQTNKDYYDAQIFSAPFDQTTIKDINTWTENETEGMIDKLIDEISPDTFMYLINALYFSGEWAEKYEKKSISDGRFTSLDGSASTVDMMNSTEGLYFSDENTTGFLKPYKGGKFAFAAFLPDEGVTISQYVAAMSAAKWKNLFDKSTPVAVKCTLPAFSYDFELEACALLKEMGMPAAFDGEKADFSGLLPDAYIGEVIHKTRIEVDAAGTKAAAVTGIGMRCESAAPEEYVVRLDRPFVYAIVDTENNYPLFLGAVTRLPAK